MNTGENQLALQKIIDFIGLLSIILLILHVYFFCYAAFEQWQLISEITDKMMLSIARTGLLDGIHQSKIIAMGLLAV